jgi:hypothetical protein
MYSVFIVNTDCSRNSEVYISDYERAEKHYQDMVNLCQHNPAVSTVALVGDTYAIKTRTFRSTSNNGINYYRGGDTA